MAQWVLWDDERDVLLSVVRNLPPALHGRSSDQLALLGYRERVIREPEDFIPRFRELLGSAKFEKMPDGRILETYPEADYSVEAIRSQLKKMVREDATGAMARTDWYVVRKMDIGTEVPKPVAKLRQRIRDHVSWLEDDIDAQPPRSLVEYQWKFPSETNQHMVNGIPVIFNLEPPGVVPPSPEPPPVQHQDAGRAAGRTGNPDPTKVDPDPEPPPPPANELIPPPPPPPEPVLVDPPPTTDGPVPVFQKGEEHLHFSAEGIPLKTIYADRVADIGPRPDNDQEQK